MNDRTRFLLWLNENFADTTPGEEEYMWRSWQMGYCNAWKYFRSVCNHHFDFVNGAMTCTICNTPKQ